MPIGSRGFRTRFHSDRTRWVPFRTLSSLAQLCVRLSSVGMVSAAQTDASGLGRHRSEPDRMRSRRASSSIQAAAPSIPFAVDRFQTSESSCRAGDMARPAILRSPTGSNSIRAEHDFLRAGSSWTRQRNPHRRCLLLSHDRRLQPNKELKTSVSNGFVSIQNDPRCKGMEESWGCFGIETTAVGIERGQRTFRQPKSNFNPPLMKR